MMSEAPLQDDSDGDSANGEDGEESDSLASLDDLEGELFLRARWQ